MRSLLPFVFILICPLMMLFMMRGMHGQGAHPAEKGTTDPQSIGGSGDDQIAELREQRDQLETRVGELEAQLDRIEASREEPLIHTSA
jgi:TolA-binding protein